MQRDNALSVQRETNSEEGFDYILYLDKGVWDHIQEADQVG